MKNMGKGLGQWEGETKVEKREMFGGRRGARVSGRGLSPIVK